MSDTLQPVSFYIFVFWLWHHVVHVEYDLCSLWFEHRGLNKSAPVYDRIKQGSIYC